VPLRWGWARSAHSAIPSTRRPCTSLLACVYYLAPDFGASRRPVFQLLVASFSLDALQLAPSVSNALNSFNLLPPTTLLRPLAHYSGAAGALLSLPAIATGISELYMMWRGGVKNTQSVGAIVGDLKNAAMTEKIQGEKIRTTLQHASLNDAVVGIAAWNWWVRRKSATLALPRVNAIASAVALPLFFYSAYLGGEA
jgi:hypothetical protein